MPLTSTFGTRSMRAATVWCCAAALLLLFGPYSRAQAPEVRTRTAAHRAQLHEKRHSAHTTAAPQPKNPAEAAAAPATVVLQNGRLTVDANNSDLNQILQDVSARSGMSVEGPIGDARVFGTYGPGNPRQVLTDLLSGSGVNFVMIGDGTGGAPRQLLLTAETESAPFPSSGSGNGSAGMRHAVNRGSGTAGEAQGGQRGAQSGGQDSGDQDEDQEPLGPGAVPHPPPQPSQDTQTRVQQQLQNLQQMHQALEQQNQPQ